MSYTFGTCCSYSHPVAWLPFTLRKEKDRAHLNCIHWIAYKNKKETLSVAVYNYNLAFDDIIFHYILSVIKYNPPVKNCRQVHGL